MCVHMCTSLCDSKNIIFGAACWLCLMLCACPNHQGSHWYTLCVSASIFLAPSPFSIFLSTLLFLLPVWHFCPYTTSLNFFWAYHLLDFNQGRLSFFPSQIEKIKKIMHISEKKVLLRNNFWLHTALTPCVINGKPNHLPRFGCKCMFCCFLLRIRQSKLAWRFTVSIH